MNKFLRNNRGFTLLELLIVAGIFMLVLIPVLSVFTSSQESYLVQDDISSTQQNIRAALMYLRKDIRMAGAGLGDNFTTFDFFDDDNNGIFAETIQVYGITAGNAIGPNQSDELIVRYVNFDENQCESPDTDAPYCSDLPRFSLPGGMPPSSVQANVAEDLNTAPFSNWQNDCNCGPDSWTLNGNYFLPAIVTSPDGSMSNLIIITTVNGNAGQAGGRIGNARVQQFDFRNDTFTVPNTIANDFSPGSTVSFFNIEAFQRVRYYIDDPDGDGISDTLMRQVNENPAMPLADGIEDLQFDYLGDFDNDGSMEVSGAPEWYNLNYNFLDPTATPFPGNFANVDDEEDVRMVRIRILARTSKEWKELGKTDSPDLDDQDNTGTKNDHFRRRVIEQDVQVRNLSL